MAESFDLYAFQMARRRPTAVSAWAATGEYLLYLYDRAVESGWDGSRRRYDGNNVSAVDLDGSPDKSDATGDDVSLRFVTSRDQASRPASPRAYPAVGLPRARRMPMRSRDVDRIRGAEITTTRYRKVSEFVHLHLAR